MKGGVKSFLIERKEVSILSAIVLISVLVISFTSLDVDSLFNKILEQSNKL